MELSYSLSYSTRYILFSFTLQPSYNSEDICNIWTFFVYFYLLILLSSLNSHDSYVVYGYIYLNIFFYWKHALKFSEGLENILDAFFVII